MSKKRILYIGTPIFNYHEKIIAEFEAQGYSVDFFNDRPSENSFVKGIIKIRKNLMNSLIQNYFNKILEKIKDNEYVLIFIVNCKVFTPLMIQQLRDKQKSARLVLYMWDSLTLYPNSERLIPIFDKVYSFDSEDCEKIEKLTFMPLFYCRDYEKLGQENIEEIEYDIVSICTAHPNRYKIIHELFSRLESNGIRIFSYMYLNKLQYVYNKLFVPEFKSAKSSEFRFVPLSYEETIDILKKSNTVFDIQHNSQSGLTLRTIETFGAKRKLITSNTNIRKYDFYNENNIFVMNENIVSEIDQFIKHDYEPINDDTYKKYSLHNWIDAIINETDNNYLR